MSKKTTMETMATQLDCSKVEALEYYDAFTAHMLESLHIHGEFTISGIGTFRVKDRASRLGRNPRTGETIEIPARRVVGFKAASTLLNHMNSVKESLDQAI